MRCPDFCGVASHRLASALLVGKHPLAPAHDAWLGGLRGKFGRWCGRAWHSVPALGATRGRHGIGKDCVAEDEENCESPLRESRTRLPGPFRHARHRRRVLFVGTKPQSRCACVNDLPQSGRPDTQTPSLTVRPLLVASVPVPVRRKTCSPIWNKFSICDPVTLADPGGGSERRNRRTQPGQE
jgi:hypothetical protein